MDSWEIQSLIDQTEEEIGASRARLDSLENDLHGVREQLSTLEQELKSAIDATLAEKSHIDRLIAVNRSNQSSIRGPGWESLGAQQIESGFEEALRFALLQAARLESVLNDKASLLERTNAKDMADLGGDLETPQPAVDSILSCPGGILTTAAPQELLELSLEEETTYSWDVVGGESGLVPYRIFTIAESGWDEVHKPEHLGVGIAASMLAAEGRRVIVILGGPAKPDIISLDKDNKLWVTETKGTFKERALSGLDLLANVNSDSANSLEAPSDPLVGKIKLWENSPAWLRRSGADVLRTLRIMESQTERPEIKAGIREIAQRYGEAVGAGFEQSGHLTEVFQIGSLADGDQLPFLDPTVGLHAYCADVKPARITQVTTTKNSDHE